MRNKPLVISVAALILLLAAYWFLTSGGLGGKKDDSTADGTSEDAIKLTDIDSTTIMHLKYSLATGENFSFKYTVYGWKVEGDEDFPLDSTYIEEMVKALCSVTSERLLTSDRSTFSSYGLDPAAVKVEMTDSKGNSYAYNIGDKHPTTSKFYFNVEGSNDVYTVPTSVGRVFNYQTLASMMKLPSFPSASPSTTSALTIETNGVINEIVRMPEGDSSCYTKDYKWFLKTQDGLRPLSEDKMTALMSTFESMGLQSGVDCSSDPAVLEKYGLNNGHKITVSYESASRGAVTETFYIGKGADGKTYARIGGSDVIGTIVNTFDYFTFDYETYKAQDFFKLTLDTVNSMTIKLDGATYTIDISRTTEKASDGKDKVTEVYTINGTELSADAVVSFFNAMRNTTTEGTSSGSPEGSPYLEISFSRNTDNYKQMTLSLWKYDSSFYISKFADNTLLVNKLDVQKIVDSLQKAVTSTVK
ncbi:MAG: DUF4340 domain-containing protein [Clostridiaceae bacterium]|nr:DUF4340 domain-containing protein [Clostridiaceae bacterium]